MIRKTLNDDTAGHSHGWNPGPLVSQFEISDSDITGSKDNLLVDINIDTNGFNFVCSINDIDVQLGNFDIFCSGPAGSLPDGSVLNYVITKLPAHVVTSSSLSSTTSASSTISDPFSLLEEH